MKFPKFEWSTDADTLKLQVRQANEIYWIIYKEDILRELEKENERNSRLSETNPVQ